MTVLNTIPNGASNKDIRDTWNAMIADIAALKSGTVTPTPTPTPTPTVSLSAATTSRPEGAAGTTFAWVYTVTRSTGTGTVTVPWAFAAGGTDAADWSGGLPAGGSLVFGSGETSKTFSVVSAGDGTTEPDESFNVSIAAPSGYAVSGAASATGTILNDDTPSTTPSAFTMTQLATPNRDYQRSTKTGGAGAGVGAIPVALNVTQAGTLYARTRSTASGNAVLQAAWKVADIVPTGTGPVSITGIHARVEQFLLDLSPDGTTWTTGTTPVGMGKLIGFGGQSLQLIMIFKAVAEESLASVGEAPTTAGRIYYDGQWRQIVEAADTTSINSAGFNALIRLQSAAEGCRVSMVGYAQGATEIAQWVPGGDCWPKLMAAITETGGRIEGFSWMQGHSDSGPRLGSYYRQKLGELFAAVDANVSDTTFTRYIATIPNSLAGWGNPHTKEAIRSAGERWCEDNTRAKSIVMDDIDLMDGTHESQAGARRIAVHFHRAMLGEKIAGKSDVGATIGAVTKAGAIVTAGLILPAGATGLSIVGDFASRVGVWPRGLRAAEDRLAVAGVALGAASAGVVPLNVTLSSDPGDIELDVWLHPKNDAGNINSGAVLLNNHTDGDGITHGRQVAFTKPIRYDKRRDLGVGSAAYASGMFGQQALSAGFASSVDPVLPAWGPGFTLDFWLYTTGAGGTNVFLHTFGEWVAFSGSEINFGGNTQIANALSANQWNHYSLTVDGGQKLTHVNGVLIRQASASSENPAGGNERLGLRAFFNGGFAPPEGTKMCQVALYDRSMRSPASFTPPTAALVGNEAHLSHLWPLNGTGDDIRVR